ncbi:pyocin activator PrtN family protein [Pleomorphomonas sp. PLEO]|uniref:pyocin activator PrtN family protein n=1 Tax=Pleomorphomonas sp. PLEO TaxID=3239306 RepID=UPI00351F46EE
MPKLLRKVMAGEIDLPVTRIEGSQKAAKGVHISDLAEYLDKRRAAAIRERDALCG